MRFWGHVLNIEPFLGSARIFWKIFLKRDALNSFIVMNQEKCGNTIKNILLNFLFSIFNIYRRRIQTPEKKVFPMDKGSFNTAQKGTVKFVYQTRRKVTCYGFKHDCPKKQDLVRQHTFLRTQTHVCYSRVQQRQNWIKSCIRFYEEFRAPSFV